MQYALYEPHSYQVNVSFTTICTVTRGGETIEIYKNQRKVCFRRRHYRATLVTSIPINFCATLTSCSILSSLVEVPWVHRKGGDIGSLWAWMEPCDHVSFLVIMQFMVVSSCVHHLLVSSRNISVVFCSTFVYLHHVFEMLCMSCQIDENVFLICLFCLFACVFLSCSASSSQSHHIKLYKDENFLN